MARKSYRIGSFGIVSRTTSEISGKDDFSFEPFSFDFAHLEQAQIKVLWAVADVCSTDEKCTRQDIRKRIDDVADNTMNRVLGNLKDFFPDVFIKYPSGQGYQINDCEALTEISEIVQNEDTTKTSRHYGVVNAVTHKEVEFRKEYISNLINILRGDNKVLLAISSQGGAGKTTVARALFQHSTTAKKYSNVIWVKYSYNLDEAILQAVDWFRDIKDYNLRLNNIFNYLQSLQSKSLLIIDNYTDLNSISQSDEQLVPSNSRTFTLNIIKNLSPNLDVIITTRLSEVDGFTMDYLPPICENNSAEGVDFFKYHAGLSTINESDIKYVYRILQRTGNNAFLIMLLARNLADRSIKDYDALLEKNIFDCSLTRVNPVIRWEIGDLVRSNNVDAIVNPTNPELGYEGIVSQKILAAAGKELIDECRKIGHSNIGNAVITPGCNLEFKIIHVPTPVFALYSTSNPVDMLRDCYNSCLKKAVANNIRRIAFPLIGSGRANFPLSTAIRIAIDTTSRFLSSHPDSFDEVRFVLYDEIIYEEFSKIVSEYSKDKEIQKLIDLIAINADYKQVLWDFALLADAFICEPELTNWLYYDKLKLNALKALVKRGFIDNTNGDYSMHDIIKSSVLSNLSTPKEFFDHLITDSEHEQDYMITYECNLDGLLPLEVDLPNVFRQDSETIDSDNRFINTLISEWGKDGPSNYLKAEHVILSSLTYCRLSNYERAELYHRYAILSSKFSRNIASIQSNHIKALSCIKEAIKYSKNKDSEILLNRIKSDYYFDYGYFLSSLGRNQYSKAEEYLKRSLDYLDKSVDRYKSDNYCEGNADIIQSVQNIGDRRAMIYDHLGYVLTIQDAGRESLAQEYLLSALNILDSHNQRTDEINRQIARVKDNLGYLLIHMGSEKAKIGKQLLDEAYAIRQELYSKYGDSLLSEYAWTVSNVGELHFYEGNYKEAAKYYKAAIKLRETLNEIRKNQYWHYIAWSKFGLALCLFRQGDSFNGKILFNEIKDIYFDLSERVDSAYIEDYRFIDSFDYEDNDVFSWYGNHAHFSNPFCLIRTKNSRST